MNDDCRLTMVRSWLLFSRWNTYTRWAAVTIAGFLIFSLLTIHEYGVSLDEELGMMRGRDAIKIVEALFSGRQFYLNDYVNYHPSFYATCNYIANKSLINCLGWTAVPAGHLLNIIIATIGLIVLFILGRQIFNARVGFVAVLFMVLFPRFIAHAQFNPKDVPLMVFATVTLLLLTLAVKTGDRRYWICAALSFGMGVDTELSGLFLIPIFFVPWLLCPGKDIQDVRSQLKNSYLFFSFAALSVFILWPVLWMNPLNLWRSVAHFSGNFRETATAQYMGHAYMLNEMPWHYLPVHLIAVTPLVSLMAIILGMTVSIRLIIQKKWLFENTLLWFWLSIPLCAGCLPGTVQYDGMRHVFIVVPALALFAGLGIDYLMNLAVSYRFVAPLYISLFMAIGWLGMEAVRVHPFEGYYLNEGVRRMIPAGRLPDYFDFRGWGTVFKQGIDWVNQNASTNSSVALGLGTLSTRYQYRPDLHMVADLSDETITNVDYVIVAEWERYVKTNANLLPVFSVRRYNVDLLWVLQNKPGLESIETIHH